MGTTHDKEFFYFSPAKIVLIYREIKLLEGIMIHAKTLNMRKDIKRKLDDAVVISGKTRSELIVLVMRKALRDFRKLVTHGRNICYQEKAPQSAWCRQHVSIFSRDYEYFLDMRKFFKRSVSLLVSYAIENYLDEVCNDATDIDNYQFLQYAIVPQMVDTAICWKIYWGFPRKIRKILL